MNTDASNVEDINIPYIKKCLLLSCVASFEDWSSIFRTRSFILCKNDLDFSDNSDSIGVSQVSPIHRESSLRTLRNAHFRGEEVLHDEGQLVASYPKKFSQVSLIDRAPQLHFSTLEKTKIDHNPLLNNLLVTVYQVPLIDHLQQQISQDLDIHTRSSPGLMKLKTTRPMASSQ